jgi:hypothetical protein
VRHRAPRVGAVGVKPYPSRLEDRVKIRVPAALAEVVKSAMQARVAVGSEECCSRWSTGSVGMTVPTSCPPSAAVRRPETSPLMTRTCEG